MLGTLPCLLKGTVQQLYSEKKRKETTTPFGGNLMGSQVLLWAAQKQLYSLVSNQR